MAKPLGIIVRPSPLARRLLLHLYSIGANRFNTAWGLTPFEKPGAGVTWVESGRGQLRIGDDVWELAVGPYFWFYGGDQKRFFVPAASGTVTTQAFWFGGPGVEGWLEALEAKRCARFRLAHPDRIHRAYRAMKDLVRRQPANWEWEVHVVLVGVLGEFLLSRQMLSSANNALPPAITCVLNAIEADPARNWRTSELAATAGMSYTAFRVLFRENLHESPHAYLQRVRLTLARQMLTDPSLRIKEIARRLHFSSDHYLSNFFHKHTGLSPTEFREHLERRTVRAGGDE